MTPEQFKHQIERLESTFGEKHFDLERLDLIKSEVMFLELGEFSRIVSQFIAAFRSAPLPKDFKEAVMAYKRNRVEDPRSKPEIFRPNFSNDGLVQALRKNYPGAKSLTDAIKIERLKIQVKKALDE